MASPRRTIMVHTRFTCRGKSMLELKQSVGVGDVTITTISDLFARNSSREARISLVLKNVGVSGPSSRGRFQARENLVLAFLEDCHAIWMDWFEKEIEARYEANGAGLEIIADVLQKGFEDRKSFVLAFIHTVTEGDDFDNEPSAIVGKQKEHLRRFIEQLVVKMGLQHPDMAASAAVLVIDRTIVRALVTGSMKEAQSARLLFQCLQHA